MIPPTPNSLLDQRSDIGQVAYQFEFYVITRDGEQHERVRAQAGSISNDTGATIKRTMRGFRMVSTDAKKVNPYSDRIAAKMRLEDDTLWDLGTFLFTDPEAIVSASHWSYEQTMVDLGQVLNTRIRTPEGIPQNGDLTRYFINRLEALNIFDYDVRFNANRSGAPIGWPTGVTNLEILNQVAQLGGATAPFFSNGNQLVCKAPPPLDDTVVHVYDPGLHSRLAVDTLRVKRQLMTAPNVYTIESNALGPNPISAVAFVDPRLPHSKENIGYERPAPPIKLQGLTDYRQALQIVQAYAETDPLQHQQASFSGPIDPRHDSYEPVQVYGERYRETSWDLPMQGVGGLMSHTVTMSLGVELPQ